MSANILYKESPWIKFDLKEWAPLLADITPVFFIRGSVIYHQNFPHNQVFIVKSGRINISIVNSEGEEKCLFVADEGCLFGEIAQYGPRTNCAQATAMTDSYVYVIANDLFLGLASRDSRISGAVIQILVKKVRLLTGQMELMSFHDSSFRVTEILRYLAESYGVPHEEGVLIDMKFTHQELANMVGVSRVTVTNIFGELERVGAIKKIKNKYLVLSDLEGRV